MMLTKNLAYVTHSSLHPLVRQMEELKFGEPSKKKQKNEENSIEEEEEIGEKVGVPMKVSDWTLMVRQILYLFF